MGNWRSVFWHSPRLDRYLPTVLVAFGGREDFLGACWLPAGPRSRGDVNIEQFLGLLPRFRGRWTAGCGTKRSTGDGDLSEGGHSVHGLDVRLLSCSRSSSSAATAARYI